MKVPCLTKRCPECEELYELPNVRESRARTLTIQYYPCSHCGYSPAVHYPRHETPGSCKDCKLPFSLVGHHSQGSCKRCQMRRLRHEMKAKS